MPPKSKKRKVASRYTDDMEFYDMEDPFALPATQLESYVDVDFGQGSLTLNEDYLEVPASPKKRGPAAAQSHDPGVDSAQPHDMEDLFNQLFDGFNVSDTTMEDREEEEGGWDSREDSQRKTPREQQPSDIPLLAFVDKLDLFLNEFLRLEAPEDASVCSLCGIDLCEEVAVTGANDTADGRSPDNASRARGYRCKTCSYGQLICRACVLSTHQQLPFHVMEEWQGSFFSRIPLKKLGIRIQLGHPVGRRCPNPRRAHDDDFIVLHMDGIESVGLDFCGCPTSPSHAVQLLRHRLFPATCTEPKTAATFNLLEVFHMLSYTSKISAHEFVRQLEKRTNNTGVHAVPNRYPSFLRMIHVFRHIRMMKWAGRGHDLSGVVGTKPGECAVLCPACPQPGINLPEGWEKEPERKGFVYRLFLAMDGNFRLRRKDVSSEDRDPGLNQGYAYVVKENEFKDHLNGFDYEIDEDKSSCNNHDAIKSAKIRGGKGLAATGMGICQCSRHDMRRPESAGDFQKGERYINMDYFFLKTMSHAPPDVVVCSYDIACQWSKNLSLRVEKYPKGLNSLSKVKKLIHLVPKYHLAAHIAACQTSFSFNFTPWVGRTHGESPERGWAGTNALSTSTAEMGPGSRRDAIDAHWSAANWEKVVDMATYLLKRAKEAIVKRTEQIQAFEEFSGALPTETVVEWTELVLEWEEDPSQENPFVSTQAVLTANQVRLRLAEEDALAMERGEVVPVHKHLTQSGFIRLGIELEEVQRKLAIDAKALGLHSTDLQRSKIKERTTALKRRVAAWVKLQLLFMPSVATLRGQKEESAPGDADTSFTVPLLLPSSLSSTTTFDTRLARHEQEFRTAQGETTLQEMRVLLILRSHMWQSKKRYASGYRLRTRSNALLEILKGKLDNLIEKYRFVRAALENLSLVTKDHSWQASLKPLTDGDVRGLTIDEEGGEGNKRLTWIWTVGGLDGKDDELSGDLRVEWCKARARAHRWQEECLLLAEEIRRVEVTFEKDAEKWKSLAIFWKSPDSYVAPPSTEFNSFPEVYAIDVAAVNAIRNGKAAYAFKQAHMRESMTYAARKIWGNIRDRLLSMDDGRDAWTKVEMTEL